MGIPAPVDKKPDWESKFQFQLIRTEIKERKFGSGSGFCLLLIIAENAQKLK